MRDLEGRSFDLVANSDLKHRSLDGGGGPQHQTTNYIQKALEKQYLLVLKLHLSKSDVSKIKIKIKKIEKPFYC